MVQWKNYNGALLLQGRPPHAKNDDVTVAEAKQALANWGGHFCRWTTDFDCGTETGWWYCIKDEAVEIDSLTAKQRYRIKKGLGFWETRRITAESIGDYIDAMYDVANECFSEYPEKYRPSLNYESFYKEHTAGVQSMHYWGLFDKERNVLQGWAICMCNDGAVSLVVVKIRPSVFKKEPNAALAYEVCRYYINECGYKYVCDGERNIRHETNYQEFLCRVLGFRLAYCKLNIVYNNKIELLMKLIRPFYGFINIMGKKSKLAYNVASLIKLDKISRNVF